MVKVVYEGISYDIPEGKTLLDGLLESGADIPHGCKTGTCQSCLLRCSEGEIPSEAQKGLRTSQKLNHLFLACQCFPPDGMKINLPHSEGDPVVATVERLHRLSPEIMEVLLKPSRDLDYRAGQFVQISNPDGITRPYSLASVAGVDPVLALHVREYPNGTISQWIHHHLLEGTEVRISEPMGECFYIPGNPLQSLLMIGTGSGLAPLYGILRDALHQGHKGPIHLYHGVRTAGELYLKEELDVLVAQHPQLHYHPCVSDPEAILSPPALKGRASDIALRALPDLKGWKIFLCGNPNMVRTTQMQAYVAGAGLEDIHADPFDPKISP